MALGDVRREQGCTAVWRCYEPMMRLVERRRFRRHTVRTQASILCARHPGQSCGVALVSDLSAGGAHLQAAGAPEVGSRRPFLLYLPWHGPLTLDGLVVRSLIRPAGPRGFGVQFVDPPEATRAALEQAIAEATGDASPPRSPATLVLGSAAMLPRLERELQQSGSRPILVTTPLDAMTWLTRARGTVGRVLLDGRIEPGRLGPLLQVLAEEFPGVERVLVLADTTSSVPVELERLADRMVALSP